MAAPLNVMNVSPIFGRFTLESLPLHEPIVVATFVAVAIGGACLLAALTYFKLWTYLWKEWFTTVDHKRIGIMYMILGIVMPGARILTIVAIRLTPERSVPTPAICSDQM